MFSTYLSWNNHFSCVGGHGEAYLQQTFAGYRESFFPSDFGPQNPFWDPETLIFARAEWKRPNCLQENPFVTLKL